MSEEEIPEYENWPASQQQREALAREMFGQYLVLSHDAWLKIAHEMLFEGYRYKSPTLPQKRFLDWIAGLADEEKHHTFTFLREIASGMMFSLLNKVDGTSGKLLNNDYYDRILIQIGIYRQTYELNEVSEQVEAIAINAAEETSLHDKWHGWLNKYSHWNVDVSTE